MKDDRLVFVYNADSGAWNALLDHLHKKLSPGTYPCRLCRLTHDGFSMDPAWRAFLDGLGIRYEFHHRDTFAEEYGPLPETPPVVFRLAGGTLLPLVRAKEFEALRTLEDLIAALRERLRPG